MLLLLYHVHASEKRKTEKARDREISSCWVELQLELDVVFSKCVMPMASYMNKPV